ncbi:MAG: DUF1206 domain-containing protein [Pseudomonadota bacterium]
MDTLDTIVIPAEFKWWAKMGYSARGVIYLVIGGLGVMAASGSHGEITDSKGAILAIVEQPFGYALLVLLVIGLFGYSLWRFIQAIRDTDDHGKSPKGLAIRVALFGSGVTHALLAVWAIALLDGLDDSSSGAPGILSSDLAQIAFLLTGGVCITAGLAHFYKGWNAGFDKYMSLPPNTQFWARPVCRFGLVARGVVWCMVGWFFIDSAMKAQADEIKGIDEALSTLQQSSHGPWLLLIVASGLFAFGIYSCLEAVYRRINVGAIPNGK